MTKISENYIPEEPRYIDRHPLLERIYEHHDNLISEYSEKPCLDVGFGKKPFSGATHGIEPEEKNVEESPEGFEAVVGVGHNMPYKDKKFRTVVAKRVIHHFDPELREQFFEEVKRVLKPGGNFIILEGTPGLYRKMTKKIGFMTGILGEDNDEYGHLNRKEISNLLKKSGFNKKHQEKLGSPLMPFSVFSSELTEKLFPIYKKTNFIEWWTLIVGTLD